MGWKGGNAHKARKFKGCSFVQLSFSIKGKEFAKDISRYFEDFSPKMFWICEARWTLQLQAQAWRTLMAWGMSLHKMAQPRPPGPAFRKRISTTISPQSGTIDLLFYTPAAYSDLSRRRHPVVVNFHGGGFTIGQATDDARWAHTVTRQLNAVVCCVEYRLAPEYPFPTAVEDGVDAILYIMNNALELGIDENRIAVSGFSAGGNMAFTVPLKLQDVLYDRSKAGQQEHRGEQRDGENSVLVTKSPAVLEPIPKPIVGIVSWYPTTDFLTDTRKERRQISSGMKLPQCFVDLFDASYLHPLAHVPLSSPYLSPGLAPAKMLKALPDRIIMYTCEMDELLKEAERMRDRLTNEAGKEVVYRKVEGVVHAWDKTTNPVKWDPATEEIYVEACTALSVAFSDYDLSIDGKGTAEAAAPAESEEKKEPVA